jgi:hypothetical protein
MRKTFLVIIKIFIIIITKNLLVINIKFYNKKKNLIFIIKTFTIVRKNMLITVKTLKNHEVQNRLPYNVFLIFCISVVSTM